MDSPVCQHNESPVCAVIIFNSFVPTEKLPLIIVNTDSDDDLYKEITDITAKPFHLAQVHVNDWNGELSPWYGEAVFGKNDFKGKANLYLKQLEEEINPEILKHY